MPSASLERMSSLASLTSSLASLPGSATRATLAASLHEAAPHIMHTRDGALTHS